VLSNVRAAQGIEFLSIRKDDLREAQVGDAVLCHVAHNGDFVARLQRISAPSPPYQEVEAARLAEPSYFVAAFVGYVQANLGVGIDEFKARHDPFERDLLRHVVRGDAVVGERLQMAANKDHLQRVRRRMDGIGVHRHRRISLSEYRERRACWRVAAANDAPRRNLEDGAGHRDRDT